MTNFCQMKGTYSHLRKSLTSTQPKTNKGEDHRTCNNSSPQVSPRNGQQGSPLGWDPEWRKVPTLNPQITSGNYNSPGNQDGSDVGRGGSAGHHQIYFSPWTTHRDWTSLLRVLSFPSNWTSNLTKQNYKNLTFSSISPYTFSKKFQPGIYRICKSTESMGSMPTSTPDPREAL